MDFRPGTFTWQICERCNGYGHHDHPAFRNGITSDEWHGPDWDDDSREAYLRGDYDVPCEAGCENGKVKVPIVSRLTFAEKRELVEQRRRDRARRECDAEHRAEMRHMYGPEWG